LFTSPSASTTAHDDGKNEITFSLKFPYSGFLQLDLLVSDVTHMSPSSLAVFHQLRMLFVELRKSKADPGACCGE
jgi:hypothetical protein